MILLSGCFCEHNLQLKNSQFDALAKRVNR